ncbi:MAG: amidohydrolase family protein [Gemmatimonadota bacterium]
MKPAVYRAAWVVPVAADPVRDGAVRVNGEGRIEWVGAGSRARLDGADIVDLGETALLPGLVSAHSHPELTLLRGRLETEAFPQWIERLIESKYRSLDSAALLTSTWLGIAESMANGVTCLAAPDDAGFLQEVLQQAGLRGRVYREVFGPDPAEAESALKELRLRIDSMRQDETDRVEVGIAPHALYTASPRLFRALAEYADAESLPVTIHVAESEAEERFVHDGSGPLAARLRARDIEVPATGRSPVAWLAETGILATQPLLVHCVRVDESDVLRVADSGSTIAHCPISNAKFGHGAAPLLFFLELGIPVGLGSDSVASNNRVDILEEARFASLLQRATYRAAGVLSAEETLRLATLEGARALGLEERIGSLEPGKEADLIAVRLDRPWTTPTGDPVAALVHSARGSDVTLTAVGGTVLYRDGRFETLDWDSLAEEGRRAASVLDS